MQLSVREGPWCRVCEVKPSTCRWSENEVTGVDLDFAPVPQGRPIGEENVEMNQLAM